MAQLITLTPTQVRLTAATWQPIYTALDVSMFDELYLVINVLSIEGGGTSTIRVITGMNTDIDDDWLTMTTNSLSTVGSTATLMAKGGFLRLLRWYVPTVGGTAITFWIGGVGRTYAKTP